MRSLGVHAALAAFTAIQPPADGVMERLIGDYLASGLQAGGT